MKILLVLPPTAERPAYAEPPLGLLYAGTALKAAGHEVAILDAYRKVVKPSDLLDEILKNGYEAIGFGGISTCYGYVKEASGLIREKTPAVHLIAGGVLSSVYELLLKNTSIDVVCMGEGEITAVNIINRLSEKGRNFDEIKGVSYLSASGIVKAPQEPYIKDLDSLPIPDYSLIDMDTYAFDAMKDPFFSLDPSCKALYRSGMRCFNVKTARGCTNSCSFCSQHFIGHRQQSVEYAINHIKYLQKTYDIHFFRFGDELFTRDKAWVIRFAERLVEEGINIRYIVHGVRTDNVDGELIEALKRSGCITVFIGFESGSAKMLEVMRKNITVEQNIAAIRVIRSSGMNVLVQTVIGMPGEDDATVNETIASLSKAGAEPEWVAINYAQAYPGTWLWKHALERGIIPDPEKYITGMGLDDSAFINYTGQPDDVVMSWRWRIIRSLLSNRVHKYHRPIDIAQSIGPKFYTLGDIYKKEGLVPALKKGAGYLARKAGVA